MDTTLASTILNQLGGTGRLQIMTGAYNFVAQSKDGVCNGVSFRLKNPKANYVKIIYNSMDLYDVEVGRIRGNDYKIIDELKGAYFDMLKPFIEKTTGLHLSLKYGGNVYAEGGDVYEEKIKSARERFKKEHKIEFYEWLKKRPHLKTINEYKGLKVGDKVTFTNDYGVVFEGYEILAIEDTNPNDPLPDHRFYLNKDSYWYPATFESLTKEEFAKGGTLKQDNEVDAEDLYETHMLAKGGNISDFDVDELDPFERMQYNQFIKSMPKEEALQVLINNVEGDISQLSPELSKLAVDEWWDSLTFDEALLISEKYGVTDVNDEIKKDLFYKEQEDPMYAEGGEIINGKKYIKKHIDEIKAGDVILFSDGKEMTVTNSNIKIDKFMGKSISGDTWNLGYKPVLVRQYEKDSKELSAYEKLKAKHPDWNWDEAEEIDDENLQAAADMFDRQKKKLAKGGEVTPPEFQTEAEYIKSSVKKKTPYSLGYPEDEAKDDYKAFIERANDKNQMVFDGKNYWFFEQWDKVWIKLDAEGNALAGEDGGILDDKPAGDALSPYDYEIMMGNISADKARELVCDAGLVPSFAKGGQVTFKRKVAAISESLEGTKVPKKYQSQYGNRYNSEEAKEAATHIAGAMIHKKMAHGGELAKDKPINIHAPAIGHLPDKKLILKYNKSNFTFDVYEGKKKVGTQSEKQVLDNLNNGLFIIENRSIKNKIE